MSLLLITEVFPPRTGGSGRWFREVYGRLPRDRVVVMAGECPGQGAFDDADGPRVVRAPLSLPSWGLMHPASLRGYAGLLARLIRTARAEGATAVHCGRCLPEGLMALALKALGGPPYACYVHGEEIPIVAASRELAWLARRVFRDAEVVVANSRNTRRVLHERLGVPPGRVVVLHPGVDTGLFRPAPRRADVRERLGWGDRPVVLTVGRLQERKGHDRMIRALRAVREAIPDVLYAILGDGAERDRLAALAAREGVEAHVQFLGERDDETLVRCYQQCDLFALPNREAGGDFEGFGMVLVEAQACGRPVLAGDSGGTAETMSIPETGLVVPCDDPGPLAAAVVDLLSDRARLDRMGEAAREWAVGQFDWDSLVREWMRIFPAPIGRRDPGPVAATVAPR